MEKRITIIVPQETHGALKVLAKADGRTLTEFIKRKLEALAKKATADA